MSEENPSSSSGAAITGQSRSKPATIAAPAPAAPSASAPLSPRYARAARGAPEFEGAQRDGRFHTRNPSAAAATTVGGAASSAPAASAAASAPPIRLIPTVPAVRPSIPSLKLVASAVPRNSAKYQALIGRCCPAPIQCASEYGELAPFTWAPGPTMSAVAPAARSTAVTR